MPPSAPLSPGVCPACRARYRGRGECPRCGADLTALMRLVVEAWEQRERARSAVLRGEYPAALRHAARAQQLHRTPAGNRLLEICQLLQQTPRR